MCWSGHGKQNFRIIFDNSVTDEDIEKFLKDKVNKYKHSMFLGKFVKWGGKNNFWRDCSKLDVWNRSNLIRWNWL